MTRHEPQGVKTAFETRPGTKASIRDPTTCRALMASASPRRTAKKAEAVASNQTLCPHSSLSFTLVPPVFSAKCQFYILSPPFFLFCSFFHYPTPFSQRTQVSLVDRVSVPETWDSQVIRQHTLTSLFSSPNSLSLLCPQPIYCSVCTLLN